MNDSEGMFKGKLQMDNFGMMGHSMGGMATTIFCNKLNSKC